MSDNQNPVFAARRAARLLAVQMLYQAELGGAEAERRIAADIGKFPHIQMDPAETTEPVNTPDLPLTQEIIRASLQSRADTDGLITGVLDAAWPIHRLDAVLRAILRAGAVELLHNTRTDHPIIISDYIDVAHAFFTGKEPGMVNGVLDKIAKQLRS